MRRYSEAESIMLRVACMLAVIICASFYSGCRRAEQPTVVVYTALDRMFSEPILDGFERKTGIKVLAKYDTEATKTVGLVNAIRAEKDRPRCDVFWNNEIVNTIRLKQEGLLQQYRPAADEAFPATFKDPDGYWAGFAARARVLIVNTNIVAPCDEPSSIRTLADPKWKGRIGIAKPLFGTTATHAACLFAALGEEKAGEYYRSLRENSAQIQSGNKTVATSVSSGQLAFGITDTDDALEEVEGGKPVKIIYPDSQQGELGVLFIPNTLAVVKSAPHAEAAKKLVEYLLSADVETALANAGSAQIPLNPAVKVKLRVKTPADVKAMDVDFTEAAMCFDKAAAYMEKYFLK